MNDDLPTTTDPDSYCCLLDEGQRCRNLATTATWSKRANKNIGSKLKLYTDPDVSVYILLCFTRWCNSCSSWKIKTEQEWLTFGVSCEPCLWWCSYYSNSSKSGLTLWTQTVWECSTLYPELILFLLDAIQMLRLRRIVFGWHLETTISRL